MAMFLFILDICVIGMTEFIYDKEGDLINLIIGIFYIILLSYGVFYCIIMAMNSFRVNNE
jgi:hypothetical protein